MRSGWGSLSAQLCSESRTPAEVSTVFMIASGASPCSADLRKLRQSLRNSSRASFETMTSSITRSCSARRSSALSTNPVKWRSVLTHDLITKLTSAPTSELASGNAVPPRVTSVADSRLTLDNPSCSENASSSTLLPATCRSTSNHCSADVVTGSALRHSAGGFLDQGSLEHDFRAFERDRAARERNRTAAGFELADAADDRDQLCFDGEVPCGLTPMDAADQVRVCSSGVALVVAGGHVQLGRREHLRLGAADHFSVRTVHEVHANGTNGGTGDREDIVAERARCGPHFDRTDRARGRPRAGQLDAIRNVHQIAADRVRAAALFFEEITGRAGGVIAGDGHALGRLDLGRQILTDAERVIPGDGRGLVDLDRAAQIDAYAVLVIDTDLFFGVVATGDVQVLLRLDPEALAAAGITEADFVHAATTGRRMRLERTRGLTSRKRLRRTIDAVVEAAEHERLIRIT